MDTEQALQTLDEMVEALNALHYLGTLLDVALNADGGTLSDSHSGLHCLMKSPLETFSDGINLLRTHVKGGDAAQIARNGPPEGWITPPIYDANSLRAEIAAEKADAEVAAAEAAAVARLRRMDLEAVARDTKLEEDTVRRVVDRLLAEPSEMKGIVASNG